MKIVFLGTSRFALPSLRELASSRHQLEAVFTQPDRRKGRGLKPAPPPVKVLAQKLGVRVWQPESINVPDSLSRLKASSPDLLVVVAYGQILASPVLGVPCKFAVNLHASLLPKYRGAAPVNWAIINGESTTGVTVIRMNEFMDRGDIIAQKEFSINEKDTAVTLGEKLAQLGAGLLVEVLDLIEKGEATFTSQRGEEAGYARKLKKEDGLIHWEKSAEEICNLLRGVVPWPGAYTFHRGKRLKIWKVQPLPESRPGPPGTVENVRPGEVAVDCEGGSLALLEVQPEGGRRMEMEEYLRGHRLESGDVLG